jgi:hypothetical protein
LTCRPRRVTQGRRGLGPWVRHRHHLVFRGRLVLPLLYGERAQLKALARDGPSPLAYHHDRRRLGAAYGGTTPWLWRCAAQALHALPPPEEGRLSLVGDRTVKGRRGRQQPTAQTTRRSPPPPSVVGFRIVRLMAPWDGDRLAVDCALVRRPGAPADQPATASFRQMRHAFRGPAWGQEVVATAAAASASRATLALRQTLGSGSVVALPRPWTCATGTALKALGTPRRRGQ